MEIIFYIVEYLSVIFSRSQLSVVFGSLLGGCRLVLLTLNLLWVGQVGAIVLYDTDNPLANTTAPVGDYANSGWAWQGRYGAFLGTMIGEQYFITAQHIGVQGSGTFVSTAAFNGLADVTYTIDTAANGGLGFWDIAGTDLRVFKILESFSTWAPIYTGGAEVGSTLVTFGRGAPRGAEVMLGPDLHGWYTTTSDGVPRWGANVVSQVISSGVGDLLAAQFNAVAGQHEATLSHGDSGGGVFIQVGGDWFLAGVNYAADGLFDTNNTVGDFSEFSAALFDRGGFYQGSDTGGWTFISDTPADKPSMMYASRISSSAGEILSIITPVPEPGALWLLCLSGIFFQRRRRGSDGHR
jgi:hypothetical protein